MNGQPLLLTGATGFLGRHIARELTLAGWRVQALVRPESRRVGLEEHVVEWHLGELRDARSLERAVRACSQGGPSAIVHAAAVLGYHRADAELQREVNVEGTRALLDAAERHGVRRFLHVGSVVAVGPSLDGRPKNESSPWEGERFGVPYMSSKRAAGELVRERSAEHSLALDTVVVEPGAIFGPGCAGTNSERFLRALAERRLGPFAPPGGMAVVGAADVAVGVRLALERGRRGARYILTERDMDTAQLARLAAARLGVRPPRWRVPRPLWRTLVAGARLVDRVKPLREATPDALTMLGLSFRFGHVRARDELGWAPRPFDEVLDETLADLGLSTSTGRSSSAFPPTDG